MQILYLNAINLDRRDALDDDISIEIISGGITNLLYRAIWYEQSVLVRIYGEKTEIMIDREIDNTIFAHLSKAGFGPTYYGRFINGRIEGWMDSRSLSPEEMQDVEPIDFLRMIPTELATLHRIELPFEDKSPILWPMLEKFTQCVATISFEDPVRQQAFKDLNFPTMLREMDWLRTVIASPDTQHGLALSEAQTDPVAQRAMEFATEIVSCHNDALSGNILYHESWDRVRIIDYEYGGYNYRAYDLANHFCEHCGFDCDYEKGYPSAAQQMFFLRHYIAKANPDLYLSLLRDQVADPFTKALMQIVNQYTLAAHLFWGTWALVQAKHSPIDFDFLNYARLRFAGYFYHKSLIFQR